MVPPRSVRLVEPEMRFARSFVEMTRESRAAGETMFSRMDELLRYGLREYLDLIRDQAKGKRLHPGFVQSLTYWLVTDEDRVVGQSHLRPKLTKSLMHEGGHIGYFIRRCERRQGYGAAILTHTLPKAFERGIDPVLITCDTDNIGSARIIEKHGGQLENRVISRHTGKSVNRYWIYQPPPD
jgi:predicted acetyltransferase